MIRTRFDIPPEIQREYNLGESAEADVNSGGGADALTTIFGTYFTFINKDGKRVYISISELFGSETLGSV